MVPRHPSSRFRLVRRVRRVWAIPAVAALAVTVVAAPVPAAEPDAPASAEPPAPPADGPAVDTTGREIPDIRHARQQVADILQTAADAVTGYREAEAAFAKVEAEIADLRAEIPRLRAEVEKLEGMVRNRAVEAYVSHDAATISVLETDNLVDARRRAHLIDEVNRHDRDVAVQLRDTREKLEAREKRLEAEQEARKEKLANFDEQAAFLSTLLVEAHEVLRKAKILEVWDAIVQRRAPDLGDGLPLDDSPGDARPEPQPDLFSDPGARPVITDAEMCPIFAPVYFTNDWGNPRSGGRTHKGTDVFGLPGTFNIAVDDGVVTDASGGLGGIAVNLLAEDGTKYYYAHLSLIHPGVVGTKVKAGDVIGYTGSTGNASPTAPHTHFQLHPDGGEPVNPYFTLFVLCGDNFVLPGS